MGTQYFDMGKQIPSNLMKFSHITFFDVNWQSRTYCVMLNIIIFIIACIRRPDFITGHYNIHLLVKKQSRLRYHQLKIERLLANKWPFPCFNGWYLFIWIQTFHSVPLYNYLSYFDNIQFTIHLYIKLILHNGPQETEFDWLKSI